MNLKLQFRGLQKNVFSPDFRSEECEQIPVNNVNTLQTIVELDATHSIQALHHLFRLDQWEIGNVTQL